MWGQRGINTHRLPVVRSYEDAERVYAGSKPIRGRLTERKLVEGDRTKLIDYCTDEGSKPIYTLYFGRELVRHHPDNAIFVAPGCTQGDTDFACHMLPSHVNVHYKSFLGRVLEAHSRVYRLGGGLRLVLDEGGTWTPSAIQERWRWPRLDARAGSAALAASPYRAFKDWGQAVIALGGLRRPSSMADVTTPMAFMRRADARGFEHVSQALNNSERWHEIVVSAMVTHYDPLKAWERAKTLARIAVYFDSKALTVVEKDWIHRDDTEAWYRAAKTYQGLMRDEP